MIGNCSHDYQFEKSFFFIGCISGEHHAYDLPIHSATYLLYSQGQRDTSGIISCYSICICSKILVNKKWYSSCLILASRYQNLRYRIFQYNHSSKYYHKTYWLLNKIYMTLVLQLYTLHISMGSRIYNAEKSKYNYENEQQL